MLYKTGDLARWLPNAEMIYEGRIDHQVKIRGFRIETGEINSVLLSHPAIKDSAVLLKQNEGNDKYLCAYIVPQRDIKERSNNKTIEIPPSMELKAYLAKSLPDYMIPDIFVKTEKLPLTVNGKLDLYALPEPMSGDQDVQAPRNELEKKLLVIWQDVLLGNKNEKSLNRPIGIFSNFFELGGHSLKATALANKIQKELNARIPLDEIFLNPTIDGLARYITDSASNSGRYVSIEKSEKKEYYPLSPAQYRLFSIYRQEPLSRVYNTPRIIHLENNIDTVRLEDTFLKLIQRHESLRTSFHIINKSGVQRIHQYFTSGIEYHQGNGNPEIETLINNFVSPFDLEKAPLLRLGLLEIPEKQFLLLIDLHHIITDFISNEIMEQNFISLYEEQELFPLKIQ
jgi:acyl carrier protein